MIVVHLGSLRLRLSHVYESYMYDSPRFMNNAHTQMVRINFLCVQQSYAYDTKTHIFTPPSDAHAYHMLRICTRTPITGKRFTLEV